MFSCYRYGDANKDEYIIWHSGTIQHMIIFSLILHVPETIDCSARVAKFLEPACMKNYRNRHQPANNMFLHLLTEFLLMLFRYFEWFVRKSSVTDRRTE